MVPSKSSPKGTGSCLRPAQRQASRLRRRARRSPGPALLLCQGGARFEGVEDDAGELALQAADGFAAALAFGLFAFEVGAGGWVDARLGDRDAVQGAVELAVAAAIEPVAAVLAGAGFEWCDAGVTGELGICLEACDRTDLAQQLGG